MPSPLGRPIEPDHLTVVVGDAVQGTGLEGVLIALGKGQNSGQSDVRQVRTAQVVKTLTVLGIAPHVVVSSTSGKR